MDKTATEHAFAQLVRRFHAGVYRVAYHILGSEADAADVAQQVFLRVFERDSGGKGYKNPEARLTWLASRLALNHLRSERRRQRREEEYAMSRNRDYEDRRVEQDEEARLLRRELYSLPEPQRMSLVLCCQEGLTLASAAELMACAESTIHARIKDGLARLKGRLEKHGVMVSSAALPGLMTGVDAGAVPSGLEAKLLDIVGGHAQWIPGLTRLKAWALPIATLAVVCVSSIALWSGSALSSSVPETSGPEPLSMRADSSVAASVGALPANDPLVRVLMAGAAGPGAGRGAPAPGPQAKTVKVGIQVVDADDKPVAGASVEVLADYRSVVTARTDKDGMAKLEIPEGTRPQWILGLKGGVGFDYYENYKGSRLALTPLSEMARDVKLVLDGVKKIRIHAETEKGTALVGIGFVPWIFSKPKREGYINLSGSKISVVRSDGKGDAIFDWIPPELWDGGDPPTGFCLLTDAYTWPEQDTRLLYSKTDVKVTARLQRKLRVSGRVIDPQGQGVSRIIVVGEGRGLEGRDYCRDETRSNSRGDFSLLLAPGQKYTLSVVDSKWAATALHFELRKEGLSKSLEIKLCRGTRVHGTVTKNDGSTPLVGLRVNLVQENPLLPDPGKLARKGVNAFTVGGWVTEQRTDKNGRFEFRVADGDYFLVAVGGYLRTTKGAYAKQANRHRPLSVKIRGQLELELDLTGPDSLVPNNIAPAKFLPESTKSYEFWLQKKQGDKPMSKPVAICSQCHVPHRER